MNRIARTDDRSTAIENRIDRSISDSIAVGTGGITFQNAGEVMEYAKMMAVSGSAVPKHLRGQPGACLGIIDDAIRFRTSPYALARKSFFVNDNLAYEAQVIAGIINRFAPLKERPDVTYSGEGPERKCIVTFKFRDGSERVYESPLFKNINPKNSPLWKNDPDQQQAYYSLRAGARRYCPEVILGMFDIDELRHTIEHHDVEVRPAFADRLAAAKQEAADEPEGFDPSFVARETEQATSGHAIDQESPADPSTADDKAAEGDVPPSSAAEVPAAADPEAGDIGAQAEPDALPASVHSRADCIKAFLTTATDKDLSLQERRDLLATMKKEWWKEALASDLDFVRATLTTADKVAKGELGEKAARGYLESLP